MPPELIPQSARLFYPGAAAYFFPTSGSNSLRAGIVRIDRLANRIRELRFARGAAPGEDAGAGMIPGSRKIPIITGSCLPAIRLSSTIVACHGPFRILIASPILKDCYASRLGVSRHIGRARRSSAVADASVKDLARPAEFLNRSFRNALMHLGIGTELIGLSRRNAGDKADQTSHRYAQETRIPHVRRSWQRSAGVSK